MPAEIAVLSDRSVLPEARRFARRLSPDAFTFEWRDLPTIAKDIVLYVKGNEQEPKLRAFLGRFRKRRYRRMVASLDRKCLGAQSWGDEGQPEPRHFR